MNIGLGLPIGDISSLVPWAQRADAGPFSTLGLLDRLVYDNPEPLVTLAALAGATSRIRLQTEVLLAPLREPTLLAKQAATLDRLSGGRFTLGIGLGGREDDYQAVGVEFRSRGRRLDEQMAAMRRIWTGAPEDPAGTVGPAPHRAGGPEVLFGAFAPRAIERIGRFGDGVLSAMPVKYTGQLFAAVGDVWRRAGRAGRPRLVAQANVALGPATTVDGAKSAVVRYYAFLGERARDMAEAVLSTPAAIRTTVATLADLGADEVMLYCWSIDVAQIDRLVDLLC